jgi:hypothetical protein
LPFVINALAYGGSWAVVLLVVRVMLKVDIALIYTLLFQGGCFSLVIARGVLGSDMNEGTCNSKGGKHCLLRTNIVTLVGLCVSLFCSVLLHVRFQKRNGLSPLEALPLPVQLPQRKRKKQLALS